MTGRRIGLALLVVAAAIVGGWLATSDENRLYALAADDGRVVWSTALPSGTRVAGTPAVANGRVVVGSAITDPAGGRDEQWQIAAFDATTGRTLWQYLPPSDQRRRLYTVDLVLTTPAITNEHVFVQLSEPDNVSLLVLDAATGQPAWTVDHVVQGHYSRFVDIATGNGRVLVPTEIENGLRLQAFDERTGAELWRRDLERVAFPYTDLGPYFATSDDTIFVGFNAVVLALDAATGATRFQVDEPEDVSGGQIWLDGTLLYRRSGLSEIVALDAATGERRWTFHQPFSSPGSAVNSFRARDDVLVAQCACEDTSARDDGWLLAINTADGTERWRAHLGAHITLYQTWPILAGDVAVETTDDGDDLVARSTADGSERWRFPRQSGLNIGSDSPLVFASDRAPRWHHWLRMAGLPGPA